MMSEITEKCRRRARERARSLAVDLGLRPEPRPVEYHVPVVAQHADGWAVFCQACSELADDYVYPCQQWQSGVVWPPPILVEPK